MRCCCRASGCATSSPLRRAAVSGSWPVGRATSKWSPTTAGIPTSPGCCCGAPRIAERFADLTKEVPGLSAGRIAVGPGSPYAGRPLGETRARTRTGASIVAIVRGDEVIASPPPSEVLKAGDVLVVIGTPSGIAGVDQIIHT